MATVVTDEFRNAQMGNPTHSAFDFNAPDDIQIGLIDNLTFTIVAGTVDYAEASAALVGPLTALAGETVNNPGIFDAFVLCQFGNAADAIHLDSEAFDATYKSVNSFITGIQVEFLLRIAKSCG